MEEELNRLKERDPNWDRELIETLATASIKEQRRSRRWGIFFKLLMFAYMITLLVLWTPGLVIDAASGVGEDHTAVVEIKGVISAESEAGADTVITGLRAAFEDAHTKGVVLRINSPGGSAVQAGYINDEIKRLKKKYPEIPVYAVVTDLCASGGYYIAVAADKIYVDKASIVGSIGVIMGTFGVEQGMEKLGIERRLITAGKHKAILDPFSPFEESERQHVKAMVDQIHQQFIDVVKEGRGDRLKDLPDTFSGLFWSGEESIHRGLADEYGSTSYVAREVIGEENLVNFTLTDDFIERFAKRIGAGAAAFISSHVGIGDGLQLR